jgi:molybdopterin converting factor small subunit
MNISLRYYNLVADLLGRREELRAVPADTTLHELLDALSCENASLGRLLPVAAGDLGGRLRLFRNGRFVLDPDEPLADGDELRLFPAISGG